MIWEFRDKSKEITEETVTRVILLGKLSNIRLQEMVNLTGIDTSRTDQQDIDLHAFRLLIQAKNQEVEKLEETGVKLFESKLRDWRPRKL